METLKNVDQKTLFLFLLPILTLLNSCLSDNAKTIKLWEGDNFTDNTKEQFIHDVSELLYRAWIPFNPHDPEIEKIWNTDVTLLLNKYAAERGLNLDYAAPGAKIHVPAPQRDSCCQVAKQHVLSCLEKQKSLTLDSLDHQRTYFDEQVRQLQQKLQATEDSWRATQKRYSKDSAIYQNIRKEQGDFPTQKTTSTPRDQI